MEFVALSLSHCRCKSAKQQTWPPEQHWGWARPQKQRPTLPATPLARVRIPLQLSKQARFMCGSGRQKLPPHQIEIQANVNDSSNNNNVDRDSDADSDSDSERDASRLKAKPKIHINNATSSSDGRRSSRSLCALPPSPSLVPAPAASPACLPPATCPNCVCVPGRSRSACFCEWQVQLNQRRRCKLHLASQRAAHSFHLLPLCPRSPSCLTPPNASCQKSPALSFNSDFKSDSDWLRLPVYLVQRWSPSEVRVPQTEEAAWCMLLLLLLLLPGSCLQLKWVSKINARKRATQRVASSTLDYYFSTALMATNEPSQPRPQLQCVHYAGHPLKNQAPMRAEEIFSESWLSLLSRPNPESKASNMKDMPVRSEMKLA